MGSPANYVDVLCRSSAGAQQNRKMQKHVSLSSNEIKMMAGHWWINDISPIDDKSSFPPALRRMAHACVCSDGWATWLLTPHPALLTWEVMPRSSILHLCHFMPCLMPTRTVSDCPAHTFQHFFFFLIKLAVNILTFPIFFASLCVVLLHLFHLLLYLVMWHVAFRQDEDEVILNINHLL